MLEKEKKAISECGLGYVACVSAAGLARAGRRVLGVNVNESKSRRSTTGWRKS